MLTVPEAARRTGRNPETIRRWIRSGRLRSQKVGTQHLVDEEQLAALVDEQRSSLPEGWKTTVDGRPMPNVVDWLRKSRRGH
jgi:excisionase family DNA binding protein